MEKNSILKAFSNRRIAAILALGFSSGIPLGLTGTTLQAWMKTEHVDLGVIGLFSLVGLPYTFKFLWSPLMDRFVPPLLGRRRGWILICQLALVASIFTLGLTHPGTGPRLTAAVALIVAFFSASQDIVVDAYRTDILPAEELGPGSAAYTLGYRIAMLFSGGAALILADHMPWNVVYLLMAASMGVGILTAFLAPDVTTPVQAPRSIRDAVIHPFVEFFKRKGAIEIILFVLLYKLDAVIGFALMTPFMMDLGFSMTEIGAVTKGFGYATTIFGITLGGAMMVRLGLLRSLWIFGLAQGLSGASFMLLGHFGHSYPLMVLAIVAENFFTGMGTAAFSAFLMSVCDKRYTATQYALLSSLFALTRVVGAAPMGFLAKGVGWQMYYFISIIAMVPGLILLSRFNRWMSPDLEGVAEGAAV